MENPGQTYVLSSVAGHEIQFWFLIAIALTIAGMFYAGACYPKVRWAGGRSLPALSWRAGLLVALVPFLLVAIPSYQTNWGIFHGITIQKDRVALYYFYPQRLVTLTVADVEEIVQRLSLKATRDISVRFITRDGAVYHSIDMRSDQADELMRALRDWKAGRLTEPARPR